MHVDSPRMNHIIRKSIGAMLLTATFAITHSSLAQATEESTTTTTTTAAGTISEFGPDGIVIKTTTTTDPVHYSSSKTITYVDEGGKAVSSKTVKSGVPVTVYYTKHGKSFMATKVIVRKAPAAPEASVEKKTTTTTTTEEK